MQDKVPGGRITKIEVLEEFLCPCDVRMTSQCLCAVFEMSMQYLGHFGKGHSHSSLG